MIWFLFQIDRCACFINLTDDTVIDLIRRSFKNVSILLYFWKSVELVTYLQQFTFHKNQVFLCKKVGLRAFLAIFERFGKVLHVLDNSFLRWILSVKWMGE